MAIEKFRDQQLLHLSEVVKKKKNSLMMNVQSQAGWPVTLGISYKIPTVEDTSWDSYASLHFNIQQTLILNIERER